MTSVDMTPALFFISLIFYIPLIYILNSKFRSFSQRANTPISRIGLCLFNVSIAILALDLILWITDFFNLLNYYSSSSILNKFVSLYDRRFYESIFPKIAYISTCGFIVGLIMFYGIIDKFYMWITHGNNSKDGNRDDNNGK